MNIFKQLHRLHDIKISGYILTDIKDFVESLGFFITTNVIFYYYKKHCTLNCPADKFLFTSIIYFHNKKQFLFNIEAMKSTENPNGRRKSPKYNCDPIF